jgi:hypothetical protein
VGLRSKLRQNRTKRPAQIHETLKLAFAIGRQAPRWADDLRWLFDLRDSAVHHRAEPGELVWDAQKRTRVPREHSLYNLEEANRAARLAIEVMSTCVDHPRDRQKRILEWMPDARHFVGKVERMRVEPLRYAL